jgi:FkbM family methyltransferase
VAGACHAGRVNAFRRVREFLGRPADGRPAEVTIAPRELGGLQLVLPRGYEDFYRDGYEPEVARALADLVEPGDVCADVGAHVGFFAMLMARHAGQEGRVLAFEASEENVSYIKRSIELNTNEAPVELYHAAVTDGATDAIELFPGRAGGDMEWTISREFAEREDEAPTERTAVTVPAVALDDVFGPGDRLDVVKMDIEGGEAVALAGARRVLSDQRPDFLVEFHREVGWPAIGHFLAAGYRFERLDGTRLEVPSGPDEVPYQFVATAARVRM